MLATPPPYVHPNDKIKFGKSPPQMIGEDDICPPVVTCPTCPKSKETKECKEEFTIDYLLGHQSLNVERLIPTAKGYANRTLGKLKLLVIININYIFILLKIYTSDCQVYVVGKPVYNRNSNASYGSWMKDPIPRVSNETIWMTVGDVNTLLEFSNKSMFKANIPTKKYDLNYFFYVSKIYLLLYQL